MAKFNLSDWRTESLRLSVFVIDAIDSANKNFWEALTGNPPDEVRARPRQQSVKEEGPLLNGWLSVEATSNRIDWRLSHNPKNPFHELPVVGPYDSLQGEFHELMQGWFFHCPPIYRLAYGAVPLFPAKDLTDAYTMLSDLLPAIKIDWVNTSDFLYRINRRRASRGSIEGLEINRLSIWSATRVYGVNVDMSPHEQQTLKVTKLVDNSVCRLELDINTAPEFRQKLDKNVTSQIFDELVNLGNEIASEGDVP